MNVLQLDEYVGRDWSQDPQYTRIINTVGSRKFQPKNKIILPTEDLTPLQKICVSRIDLAQELLKNNRDYNHKSYSYDNMNEMERFGAGRYSRSNIIIISFEDCLDFIYSCLFRTKQGDLKKFCERKDINYNVYSRQHLAGGFYEELYLTDLMGFSPSFDVVIDTIGSEDSIEKRIYFSKLYKFCEDFRNALLIHTDEMYRNISEMILASAGITSAVYYSDGPVEGEIIVRYKMYETKLKILSVKKGKYLDAVNESLCN